MSQTNIVDLAEYRANKLPLEPENRSDDLIIAIQGLIQRLRDTSPLQKPYSF